MQCPQILSVNPDMNIDSFVMPANDEADGNTLNSGIDLGFCVTAACENKEAAYEVLDFLLEDENIQPILTTRMQFHVKKENLSWLPMWTA